MIRLLSFVFALFVSSYASSTTLLILGDSLSAGYQMPIAQAWPSLLPEELAKQNKTVDVVNASISGDTTGNGLSRLPSLLQEHQPSYVLIELGANDGLRGFPPNNVEKNLSAMIAQAKASGATPILMQIRVPPNYGNRYSDAFFDIYPTVAQKDGVSLIPFFLEQVIIKPEWMMSDGLHPKPEAQPFIAEYVAGHLVKHL
ncbi:multifunctional acyl-CoA thioesterase I/protease I/lysophospholipase L1 [Vibrio paucivorans]|uniref:Multifunctional acyl-CoA thioesterase I/protease I/lysophospholipase L1 n=1 Tax=Vibrio paucivorans TaxID=2829489 RepID=A0A9X3HSL8_9VIBR|nr:multifunctional acyl-CoA thioesterase I/protease I/lysophospholipase L1 [Vibrio paucivorans]MCW8334929.1 multifunctional acyl-CoA thioesterase I/protease I/lysophospholipase L1 [Vibrio paucivorans]